MVWSRLLRWQEFIRWKFGAASRGVIIDNKSTFMQDDDEEGTMPAPFMVVVHEARFSIFLQKETDARSRGADHVGWRVLIDLWSDQLRHAVFSMSAGDRQHAPVNRPGNDSVGFQPHATAHFPHQIFQHEQF